MEQLTNISAGIDDFCIWRKLLSFLGCQMTENCGTNCTRCKPEETAIGVPEIEETFRRDTPLGIPAIGFADRREVTLDLDRLDEALDIVAPYIKKGSLKL